MQTTALVEMEASLRLQDIKMPYTSTMLGLNSAQHRGIGRVSINTSMQP